MSLVPLPVYPPLTPERLELLKMAKASLNLDVKIVPVDFNAGGDQRVLAWERPDHICRWAPIRPENAASVPSIAAAMRFILEEDPNNPDPRWGFEDWMSEVMGVPVVYSHTEDHTGKVQFA